MVKQSKKVAATSLELYPLTVYAVTVTVVIFIFFFWWGYSVELTSPKKNPNTSEYLKWKSANIENYSFLLNSNCTNHNAIDLLVEVRNGQVVWPRSTLVPNFGLRNNYPSIEHLLDLIDKATKTADDHKAYYHKLGLPIYASIDWNKQIIDEECEFIVEQFRILNGIGTIPSLQTKRRLKEPRFVLPEHTFLYENCCSLGPLRSKEERDKLINKHPIPKSIVNDLL